CRYRFVSSSLLTRAGHNRRLHSFPTRRSSDLAAMKLGSSIAWVLAAGCTALAVQPARAQSWEPTGMPIGFNGPTVLYADTVHDALLVSGLTPITYNDRGCFPLLRLKDDVWDTLGLFWSRVSAAVTYHDSLIIGGSFDGIGNDSIGGIACYVDGGWASYGSMNAYDGGIYKL